jgi:biotin carboxyl carrier protein
LTWLAPQALAKADIDTRLGHIRLNIERAAIQSQGKEQVVCGTAVQERAYGEIDVGDTRIAYRYVWSESILWLHTAAADYAFECLRRQASKTAGDGVSGANEVRATINGRVIEVAVSEGQPVAAGQRLLVIEAMKMEHEVRAARPGTAARVTVSVGDQVTPGQCLVRIEGTDHV